MMSAQNFPSKKLSRMKNPFENSSHCNSLSSHQNLSNKDSPPHYDKQKISNVFQFNDRQRVMISDSNLGSESNNQNQSGENIYTFNSFKGFSPHQQVEEIPNHLQKPALKLPTYPSKHHEKVQKSSSLSNVAKHLSKKHEANHPHVPKQTPFHFPQIQQPEFITNTIKLSYQPSEVTMYRFSQHPETQNSTQKLKNSDDLSLIELTGKSLISKPETGIQEGLKKTFKPGLLNNDSENSDQEEPEPKFNFQHTSNENLNGPNIKQKMEQVFSFEVESHRKSVIPKVSSQVKEQIQQQNIDIFISPPQNQSTLAKDKQKAKILQEELLRLSKDSSAHSAHSYTDTILDEMRDKIGPPIEHVQIPFESKRDSGRIQKEVINARKIVESKIVNMDTSKPQRQQIFKPSMTKKPRKKIFESTSQKRSQNQSTNFTRTPRSHFSPYVSQFEKERIHTDRDVSPSQILMKSLDIIDKLAAQKAMANQNLQERNDSKVVVVPPAPLTITQTQPNGFSAYSLTPEEMELRKEILDLSFQISLIETSFDLQKFGSRELIHKVNILDEKSLKLFEKYKKLLMTNQMISMQSSPNNTIKKDIMEIRQMSAKLANFQEKYQQILGILKSLEDEIKDILLLSLKEKYKKIKLLNEAIDVMAKTETYLSLESGKIPVLIKGYVGKQKILLEELRDWLKDCINKQNAA